jgi:hypothetical protein
MVARTRNINDILRRAPPRDREVADRFSYSIGRRPDAGRPTGRDDRLECWKLSTNSFRAPGQLGGFFIGFVPGCRSSILAGYLTK